MSVLLRKAPFTKVGLQNKILYVGFGSIQFSVSNHELFEPILRLLSEWREASTVSQMRERFSLELEHNDFSEVFEHLAGGPYVLPDRAWLEGRYSRHMMYYDLSGVESAEVQSRLAKSCVTIIGCGGIGSLIATTLAAAGVGQIHLIDDDAIELSNLTRQYMYTERECGQSKVVALESVIAARNSEVTLVATERSISTVEDIYCLLPSDLIILSGDSDGLLETVNRACIQTKTPFIHACYVEDIAVWGPLVIPGQTACWGCEEIVARSESLQLVWATLMREVNEAYRPPSFGPINMLASAMASKDAIKYLGRFGNPACLGKRVGIWTHDLKVEEQVIKRNPKCSVCGNE